MNHPVDYVVSLFYDGTGNVSLTLKYRIGSETVRREVLHVPFVNWVPNVNTGSDSHTANYTCEAVGPTDRFTSSGGRQINLNVCQCCDLSSAIHADIHTCPIVSVDVSINAGSEFVAPSFVGYALCMAFVLVGLY